MKPASLIRPCADDEDLTALETIATSLARALPGLLSNRQALAATVGPVAQSHFTEWRSVQNPFGMLLRYTFGQQNEEVALHIPGYLVSQIIDIQYGGTGVIPVRGNFTATETKFVERLAAALQPCLTKAIAPGAANIAQLVELQPDILTFDWPKARDQIAMLNVFVEHASIKAATISCFMDIATARQIVTRSASSPAGPHPERPDWQARMRSAAMNIPVPARAVLTSAMLPAARLMTLAPGDILPVLLPTHIPLTVEGRHIARGTIGDANGRAALKIDHIEGIYHE
jgi:flagellar motor switch protein FliM